VIVEVLAHTILTPFAYTLMETEPETAWGDNEPDADRLIEIAGRNCYQSWAKPNPATASNWAYTRNIINQEHFSVMEHPSITFYLAGISRNLTHELIRHRHLSFSELSQRFVNGCDSEWIVPPALRDLLDEPINEDGGLSVGDAVAVEHTRSSSLYADLYSLLRRKGLERKPAREAARSVLFSNTETKMVVSGNIRAWREVIHKRYSEHADAEIQELAGKILGHLQHYAPHSVQDIPDYPRR